MNSMNRTGGTQQVLARKLAPQTGYGNVKVPKATVSFVTSVSSSAWNSAPAGRLFVTCILVCRVSYVYIGV
jgi:hypothetical protein